jgi:hypothetical protein
MPRRAAMPDLGSLTAADFARHTGGRFRIHADPPFDAELTQVSEADGGAARRQFSLMFRGGPSPPLPQRIYRVEHAELGRLDIFLVPVGPDAEGQRYEAVFT